jgi:L-fucose isomerase-like protein
MINSDVRIGFAPTRRAIFDKVEAKRFKDAIERKLRGWRVDYVNLDFLNQEGLLYQLADAQAVADRFRAERVDAVFIPHCNFGTEDAAAKVCKLVGKPVLLWGPRDDAPEHDGTRKRDTQCGLFATSKALRRFGLPFTYLPNSWVDSPEFERGFKAFLRVVAAQRAVLGARIGQVSTRPKLFWSVMVNEGELLERFGVEVVPATLMELQRGVEEIIAAGSDDLRALAADLKSRIAFPNQSDQAIQRHAALILWQRKWAERERLSALAIQCWSDLPAALGLWPCFANGEVTGGGIPVGCETDVHGALTALMMQAAAGAPTFCADLTIRHPQHDNAELLWHCGPFPSCLADEGVEKSVIGYDPESKVSGLGQWRIRGGPITIGRLDGDNGKYSLFIGQGAGTDGPYTRGTYVWLEVSDWLAWEEKLIYGPYIHHVTGVHGHVAPILYEACKYLPGLSPDPVEPEAAALRRYWRQPC